MRIKKIAAAVFTIAATLLVGMTAMAQEDPKMRINYSGYSQAAGWSNVADDNTVCSFPNGDVFTSFKANLLNQPQMTGTVSYQVNSSGKGWLPWVENAAEAGFTDTEQPLEAIRMKLTGELEANYDIYYRVAANGNWQDWVMNGQIAGEDGNGYRISAIRVAVVAKDSGAPEDKAVQAGNIDPSKPMVALTFDDGPNAGSTDRILASLQENGGRATFFMVGSRVTTFAAQVRQMVAQGCEVANHTFDHKYINKLSDAQIRDQINRTNATIASVCGVTPTIMRPCGGNYNAASLSTLGSMGIPAIMWSIDTLDWKTKNPSNTIQVVLNNIKDGDIVLMHDLYNTTADAAVQIIPALVQRGYQLVTVSELASYRGGMTGGQRYSSFR